MCQKCKTSWEHKSNFGAWVDKITDSQTQIEPDGFINKRIGRQLLQGETETKTNTNTNASTSTKMRTEWEADVRPVCPAMAHEYLISRPLSA